MQNRAKRTLIFGIIAGVGIVLIIAIIWAQMQKNKFLTFSNFGDGYSISYPSDWTFTEGYMQTSAMFFSKQETAMDTFKENVGINIQDISGTPRTLDEYTQEAISQMDSIFSQHMSVLESEPTTLDGIPAHKYVIIARNANNDMQLMFVWAIDGARVFQLTFTTLTSTFERYYPKFDRMQKSFKFLK